MKQKLFNIIITILAKTWRIKTNSIEIEPNSIVGFWHSRMLPAWYFFKNQSPYAVVSKSKDGEILSALLESWGIKLIRGSSSKDGKEVLENIIEKVSTNLILMTPDGPRGPKEEFKAGIFIASQRAQKPFYFIEININHKYIFKKAWDKFELPLPFTKIEFKIKGAYNVPSNLNKEELSEYIKSFKV